MNQGVGAIQVGGQHGAQRQQLTGQWVLLQGTAGAPPSVVQAALQMTQQMATQSLGPEFGLGYSLRELNVAGTHYAVVGDWTTRSALVYQWTGLGTPTTLLTLGLGRLGQTAVDTTTTATTPVPTVPSNTGLYIGAALVGVTLLGAMFYAFGQSSMPTTSPNPIRRVGSLENVPAKFLAKISSELESMGATKAVADDLVEQYGGRVYNLYSQRASARDIAVDLAGRARFVPEGAPPRREEPPPRPEPASVPADVRDAYKAEVVEYLIARGISRKQSECVVKKFYKFVNQMKDQGKSPSATAHTLAGHPDTLRQCATENPRRRWRY